jgi:chaperonin GroES
MIQPLGDRVVIRPIEEKQTGLIIRAGEKEKPAEGMVIAIGPGRTLDSGMVKPCEMKVNDRVLYGKYAGAEIKVEGEKLLVMREDDVLAVLL